MSSIIHCFEPIIDNNSEILILGTMPGKESLKKQAYYASDSNHFWDFIYKILQPSWEIFEIVDESISFGDRYSFLLKNKIALWDVIQSCERDGSSDSKIKNEVLNDFDSFFGSRKFKKVLFNGQSASKFLIRGFPELYDPNKFSILNSTSTQNRNNTFKVLREWHNVLLDEHLG